MCSSISVSGDESTPNPISGYFSAETVDTLKEAIRNADGNEVLFFGWIDDERVVEKIEVIARGNEESVADHHTLQTEGLVFI
jgi:hypothetical protein